MSALEILDPADGHEGVEICLRIIAGVGSESDMHRVIKGDQHFSKAVPTWNKAAEGLGSYRERLRKVAVECACTRLSILLHPKE